MGCIRKVLKYILIVFNIIFIIVGIALIVISSFCIGKAGNSVAIFALVVGVLICLVSFFGCFGAIKEDKCLLITYAVILIVLFILDLAVGIYAFVQINDSKEFETLEKHLQKMIDNYGKDDKLTKAIDGIQKDNKCCGLNGPHDYIKRLILPESCLDEQKIIYTRGCLDLEKDNLKSLMKATGGIAIAFAIVKIVVASFALILALARLE